MKNNIIFLCILLFTSCYKRAIWQRGSTIEFYLAGVKYEDNHKDSALLIVDCYTIGGTKLFKTNNRKNNQINIQINKTNLRQDSTESNYVFVKSGVANIIVKLKNTNEIILSKKVFIKRNLEYKLNIYLLNHKINRPPYL